MRWRVGWTLAHLALALALLVLPVALAVRYASTSDAWWQREFERYDAVARTGLTPEEVDRVAAETREYLSNDDELLNVSVDGVPFYSEREVLHMVDVKRLMARVYDAGWAALGYIIAFAAFVLWRAERALRSLARSVLFACGIVAVAFIALADLRTERIRLRLPQFPPDLLQQRPLAAQLARCADPTLPAAVLLRYDGADRRGDPGSPGSAKRGLRDVSLAQGELTQESEPS